MVAGAGIMVLLGVALLAALTAGWWLAAGRRTGSPDEVGEVAAGAVALPADAPTHLVSTLAEEEPVPDDAPTPGRSQGLAPAVDERLRELDDLLARGLIDQEEYTATRTAILGHL